MALWDYAIFSTDEARRFLGVGGSAQDDKIDDCINEASYMIEDAWGRQLVSRGTLTEYHPRDSSITLGCDLYTNEYPLVSVSAVYEAGTLLTVNTDYRVILSPVGLIRRLSSGFPVSWPQTTSTSTYRHVEVRYVAGYRPWTNTPTTTPVLPEGVKRVGRELVAWIYRQRDKREVGLSSVSDDLGNRTFSGPAYVTPGMLATLRAAGACFGPRLMSGERDS